MMESRGTSHMTSAEFVSALEMARPGENIVYATGDIAYSANDSSAFELRILAKTVRSRSEEGLGRLFQRPCKTQRLMGGRAFQYIFKVAR